MEKKSKIDLLGSINANEKYVQVNFTVSHVYETENRLESLERWFTIPKKLQKLWPPAPLELKQEKMGIYSTKMLP
jgi:hypothetical protein